MSREESKNEYIRACKALGSSETLLEKGFHEDSISRSYYSVLHSAKAVLILKEVEVKSHRAVRKLFGQHFIKTGIFESRYGKILSQEQDIRIRADYDAMYVAEDEEAKECFTNAKDFLSLIKEYLNKNAIDLE